ncbi:MAG: hypothetical protein ACOCZC_02435 [Halodesulfurarchaeum sp.]
MALAAAYVVFFAAHTIHNWLRHDARAREVAQELFQRAVRFA